MSGPSNSTNNSTISCAKCCSRKRSLDTFLWLSVLTVMMLSMGGVIPPRKSGFYCNDSLLMQKYTGDTISAAVLLSTCIMVPIITIMLIEAIYFKTQSSACKVQNKSTNFRHSRIIIADYMLGFLFTLTLIDLLKSAVGEKRPHFLDSCRPSVNCTASSSKFVADYECTAKFPQWYLGLDIYKSFPSGHAALSLYMAVFMIVYIHRRISLYISHILRPFIQFLFLIWAFMCCISRIIDNRHFWWDVLGGSIIGIVAAYATIVVFELQFKPKTYASEQSDSETTNLSQQSSAMVIISNKNTDN